MDEIDVVIHLPRGIDGASRALEDEVEKALVKASASVEGAAKRKANVATGNLRRSIFSKVESLTGTISAPTHYAPFIEYGTRPHTPPMAPIRRWALRKGMMPGAVWAAIRKRGTRAHPFMRPAFEEKREGVVETLRQALQDFVDKVARER